MDLVASDWNWEREPFRDDPITQRAICRDCWNGTHGIWHNDRSRAYFVPGCRVADCACYCVEEAKVADGARCSRGARARERKAAMRAPLSLADNPLRALNPDFRKRP